MSGLAKLNCFAVLVLGIALAGAEGQKTTPTRTDDDPVLHAMRVEMERSKSQLKLDGVQAPYYIEYRIVDMDDCSAEAVYGALRSLAHNHARLIRVVVRVGDYKQDSYFGAGEGVVQMAPLDDDVQALRHQLWLATDGAYKAASEALAAKQAQLKQLNVDQPVDDFARAPTLESVGPVIRADFNTQPWQAMLEEASGLYRGAPEIEYLSAVFRFVIANRYFVNSEGTVVRGGRGIYFLYASGAIQAGDGMRLERSYGDAVTDLRELSREKFVGRVKQMLATLKQLREAPLVDEDYRGPVLFSGDAAATVVGNLVGPNVVGKRPGLGQNGRTAGAWATSYKSRVLPDFLSVVDDPTLTSFNGESLLGAYQVDDEGVKAERVTVVEKGQLINYLLGRQPIRDFPVSNGHGRAAAFEAATPNLGNLIVQAAEGMTDEKLESRLMEFCRERDLPYGYIVDTMGPGMTPRLLYRIWAKDGHRELVRGAVFGDLDTRSLRNNVIAAGVKGTVESRLEPVPASIISPALLFDELELKRSPASKEKLPDYPPPAISASK